MYNSNIMKNPGNCVKDLADIASGATTDPSWTIDWFIVEEG